jgi:hypothetical protein
MATKRFKVGFYVGQVGADGDDGSVSDALSMMVAQGCPIVRLGSLDYEIRELRQLGNGATFTGVFAKFRSDDLPHVGQPGGRERELAIDPADGLLEKNYFVYYRMHQLIVFQENGHGSKIGRVGEYLSQFLNVTTVFQPVLQPDATQRLLRGDVRPLSLDMSFAKPTNTAWYPADDFNRSLLALMESSGGAKVQLSIRGPGRGPLRQPLGQRIKRSAVALMGQTEVTTARLVVEDQDGRHPIDLIADRIASSIDVEMAGRYPVPAEVLAELRRAKDEHNDDLTTIFGAGNRVVG